MSFVRLVVVLLATSAVVACSDGGGGDDDGGPDPSEAVYDPTRILEVDIEVAQADWDALRFQTRGLTALFGNCLAEPFESPFTYFSGVVRVDGQVFTSVGVRKKGFLGSLDTQKPSLKLKFDEFVPDQRFAGLKTLTLNNAKQDPSYIKQCLTYQTFAAAGVPASRCNFARVRVNGNDMGLYVNVEAITKPMLRRHFDDDEGNLYEGTLSDFRAGWLGTFELKTNEAENDRTDLAALTTALEATDAQLLAALDPLVDVDGFLTFWATETLVGHWDGYTGNANNFYAYHDPVSGQFHFLPWGVDGVLEARDNPFGGGGSTAVQVTTMLPRRLYQLPETRDRYVERLRAVLDDVWDVDAMFAEIDRMEELVRPVVLVGDREQFATAVNDVRAFVSGRRAALEADLAGGPPVITAPLREPPCFEEIGSLSGSFSTRWGTTGAPDPFATGSGSVSGTVNGTPLSVTGVGSTSGMDPNAMPPKAQVAVVAALADGTAGIIVFQVEPSLMAANTDLPIDLGNVVGVVYHYTPATNGFVLVGLVGDGTLRIGEYSATDGATVTGSFSGTLIQSPF
ncbi:MAG: CotH kinase family protein [Deltaproteobacteria bacterium]|nr:CotH kinase family protein [Kofleriaceae bacterium]